MECTLILKHGREGGREKQASKQQGDSSQSAWQCPCKPGSLESSQIILGSLSMRVFEMRTATGKEYFVSQDSGVSQIFILIISNGEKILSNVNVVM